MTAKVLLYPGWTLRVTVTVWLIVPLVAVTVKG